MTPGVAKSLTHSALGVNGNRRMEFAFEGKDAVLVDYRDYH